MHDRVLGTVQNKMFEINSPATEGEQLVIDTR